MKAIPHDASTLPESSKDSRSVDTGDILDAPSHTADVKVVEGQTNTLAPDRETAAQDTTTRHDDGEHSKMHKHDETDQKRHSIHTREWTSRQTREYTRSTKHRPAVSKLFYNLGEATPSLAHNFGRDQEQNVKLVVLVLKSYQYQEAIWLTHAQCKRPKRQHTYRSQSCRTCWRAQRLYQLNGSEC